MRRRQAGRMQEAFQEGTRTPGSAAFVSKKLIQLFTRYLPARLDDKLVKQRICSARKVTVIKDLFCHLLSLVMIITQISQNFTKKTVSLGLTIIK